VPVYFHQGFEQDVFRAQSRWLVGSSSSRKLAGFSKHFKQRVAIALASRKDANALLNTSSPEKKKTAEQACRNCVLRGSARQFAKVVQECGPQDRVLYIGPARNNRLDVVAELVFAGGEWFLAGQQF